MSDKLLQYLDENPAAVDVAKKLLDADPELARKLLTGLMNPWKLQVLLPLCAGYHSYILLSIEFLGNNCIDKQLYDFT